MQKVFWAIYYFRKVFYDEHFLFSPQDCLLCVHDCFGTWELGDIPYLFLVIVNR
jgi:hypothetical protein